MVRKPKERVIVQERSKISLQHRADPLNAVQEQRVRRQEQVFYQNIKARYGTWACRVTVPLTSIEDIKRASREMRALANEFNQIAKMSDVYIDQRIMLAQSACKWTNHTLKVEAGADPKTGAYRGVK